ncbi:MAG: hypothetical protein HN849_17455 [Victivallales bacterium]|nr:hypothetical protein [Victivallales bacterium]MBT7301313.1 hypothetical protein [Victivallales bacterium]
MYSRLPVLCQLAFRQIDDGHPRTEKPEDGILPVPRQATLIGHRPTVWSLWRGKSNA